MRMDSRLFGHRHAPPLPCRAETGPTMYEDCPALYWCPGNPFPDIVVACFLMTGAEY